MIEYISREAVKQVICGLANGLSVRGAEALKAKDMKAIYKIRGGEEILNTVDNDLCFIPAADAQPVVHGYWEECRIRGTLTQSCSECGGDCGVLYPYSFCPNCGARMDLKDGDTECQDTE